MNRIKIIDFKKLLSEKTDKVIIQFIRYFMAGSLAYIFDFGSLILLTFLPFFKTYYILAASLSFIIGLVTNYFFSIRWVFKTRNIKNTKVEFILFAVIGSVGLILNGFFIWLFTDYIFEKYYFIDDKQVRILLSKIISAFFVYIWNFTAKKSFLFRDNPK